MNEISDKQLYLLHLVMTSHKNSFKDKVTYRETFQKENGLSYTEYLRVYSDYKRSKNDLRRTEINQRCKDLEGLI